MSSPALSQLFDFWSARLDQACWHGGLMVLAVAAICWLLPTTPARWQSWFWRLALLKFAVVLLVPTLIRLPLLPPAPQVVAPAVQPMIPVQIIALPVVEASQPMALPPPSFVWPSLGTVLCTAWLLGVGWSCVRLLRAWFVARRMRRRSQPVTAGPLVEQLQAQRTIFGLRRCPRLLVVPGGGSPMLLGVWRPVIVLPQATLARLNAAEQAMVLGHELAHIRRGDLYWGLLATWIRAVFFFHPLVWLAHRQLRVAQELAADELAIARQRHKPLGYGGLLVSVVEKLGSSGTARPLVSTIALETAGPVHSLTRRLVAMSRIGSTSRRVLVSVGVLLGAVVVLGLLPWRLVAAEPKPVDAAQPAAPAAVPKPASPAPKSAANKAQKSVPTQYLAHIRITEEKGDEPAKCLSAPSLLYLAGHDAIVVTPWRPDPSKELRVTLKASGDNPPLPHTMQATLQRRETAQGSPADNDAWKSPEVHFANGATGTVAMRQANGTCYKVEATVSPTKPSPFADSRVTTLPGPLQLLSPTPTSESAAALTPDKSATAAESVTADPEAMTPCWRAEARFSGEASTQKTRKLDQQTYRLAQLAGTTWCWHNDAEFLILNVSAPAEGQPREYAVIAWLQRKPGREAPAAVAAPQQTQCFRMQDWCSIHKGNPAELCCKRLQLSNEHSGTIEISAANSDLRLISNSDKLQRIKAQRQAAESAALPASDDELRAAPPSSGNSPAQAAVGTVCFNQVDAKTETHFTGKGDRLWLVADQIIVPNFGQLLPDVTTNDEASVIWKTPRVFVKADGVATLVITPKDGPELRIDVSLAPRKPKSAAANAKG